MEHGLISRSFPVGRRAARGGFAIVLVLSFLALILVLTLAFFLTTATELESAKGYARGTTSKELGDSAVQLAMASIRTATTTGSDVAWASQPGMIRTYNNQGQSVNLYKLYSSDQMVQTRDTFSLDAELNVKNAGQTVPWRSSPAFFTDLNSPLITSGAGTTAAVGSFPIIDGNGMTLSAGNLIYPGTTGPEGFSVDSTKITYAPGNGLSATNNPVPVPAKWLYVLENGKIVAPTLVAGGSGKIAVVAGADQSPIVGRIAFWTDDETSKVNINTASEGTFWDMPRAEGSTERGYGSHQTATREFQRYPGHPATTSLSAVFPALLTGSGTSPFYSIAPRVSATGANPNGTPSPGGVTLDHDRLYDSLDELLFDPTRATTPLTQDNLRKARFFATAYNRAPEVNLFNKPRITIWPIDGSFLANPSNYKSSTSPNARVTPTDQLIAFCSTMRNDLNAGRYPYFFQRNATTGGLVGPDSATSDISIQRNKEIYAYLQSLTGASTSGPNIPGFGGNFLAKYGADRDQILTEIFDYIRSVNLTDATLGGGMPAGTAATTTALPTYAPARSIKTTINGLGLPSFSTGNPWGHGLVTPTEYTPPGGAATRGFGRFDTVSGAFLWFSGIAQTETVGSATTTHNQDGTDTTVPSSGTPSPPLSYTRVQPIFALDFFNVAYNWPYPMCGFEYAVKGLDQFQWRRPGESGYTSMRFPAATSNFPAGGPLSVYWKGNQMPGGRQGFMLALSQKNSPTAPRSAAATASDNNRGFYPFCGGVTPINATLNSNEFPSQGSYIDFKGGDVTISLLFNQVEIQSITLNFPDGHFPVPGLANKSNSAGSPARNFRYFFYTPASGSTDLGGRFYSDNTAAYVDPNDVIEEVVATSGDFRTIAGQRTITTSGTLNSAPYNLFRPHPLYGDGTTHFAHNLWGEGRYPILGATYGSLANGATYGSNPTTDTTNWSAGHAITAASSWWGPLLSTTGVVAGSPLAATAGAVPGDWDNGMADEQDGPYINKVDEGNLWGLDPNGTAPAGTVPYFTTNYRFLSDPTAGKSYFSPNRQLPSAAMFGSLSTGVARHLPWQTLLFRPDPAGHPGQGVSATGLPPFTTPPDYLLMDLFTMPVAEPYAISEPFSTAGKVNMNYQIMPYTYLKRETAIRAVLKSEQIMAIQTSAGPTYKSNASNSSFRFPINLDETLKAFESRFDPNGTNDLFRSATEICSVFLLPNTAGATYAARTSFWDNYRLTGDNTRERPYANIYPRLTTKSNTFTVHYRAQALKRGTNKGSTTQWDEATDTVVGEFRGSSVVERYIDPNDPTLPDFVTNPNATVDSYYRLRVLSTKQFNQ